MCIIGGGGRGKPGPVPTNCICRAWVHWMTTLGVWADARGALVVELTVAAMIVANSLAGLRMTISSRWQGPGERAVSIIRNGSAGKDVNVTTVPGRSDTFRFI